jgi:hypothetical protein
VQLSTMQGLISQRLAEGASGPVFYPTAEITAALNEGNRLFVLLTLGLETTQSWAPGIGNGRFHMLGTFADWIVPLRITGSAGGKIRPARLDELACLDSTWPTTTTPGDPQRYVAMGNDFIAIYPTMTNNLTLTVTYAQAPVALVNATDTPAVPAEYHPKLVDFAINRMRMVEGIEEYDKTLPLFGSFLEGATHYGNYVRARNRGAQYDKVPFELEKYDKSRLLKLRRDLVPTRKGS